MRRPVDLDAKPYLVIPPALWMAVPLVGLTRIVPVGAMFTGPSLLPCLSLVHAFHRVCIVPSQIDARNVSHAALNWALAAPQDRQANAIRPVRTKPARVTVTVPKRRMRLPGKTAKLRTQDKC